VFAANQNGTAQFFSAGTLQGYSLGLSFTSQQLTDYYNAMLTFQQALGRN
jgi:hypothetical protein